MLCYRPALEGLFFPKALSGASLHPLAAQIEGLSIYIDGAHRIH